MSTIRWSTWECSCYCSIPESCLSLCYPRDCVACQAPLSSSVFWSLLKLMSMESVMLSDHLILCHPLLLSPSIFPSIRAFSSGSALRIRWPKCWSFSSPSKEYSGLIPFRIDWFSSCSPGDSQESSLAQFKSIRSCLLHKSFKHWWFWWKLWHPPKSSEQKRKLE